MCPGSLLSASPLALCAVPSARTQREEPYGTVTARRPTVGSHLQGVIKLSSHSHSQTFQGRIVFLLDVDSCPRMQIRVSQSRKKLLAKGFKEDLVQFANVNLHIR